MTDLKKGQHVRVRDHGGIGTIGDIYKNSFHIYYKVVYKNDTFEYHEYLSREELIPHYTTQDILQDILND